ncbi:acetyl-CoA carboxylase biotin carboxyl carrier protein subunit [Streptococcus pseudoporcinus]|uniref:Biotin carboxyl carrier protein of acetyl-CoA carboxylase n=1 Tax=Streptococcus pseudoporcinus TaxID=361101 RepID=A0A4U9XNX2_9STRE|nr:acetyl-CoA carboxylase biotin carboxyl carrier protein subunit [Streptococcus pseudoporcinus]VTS15203.1 acetyl-CoA carboxylase biotin carboxyl carrier protein subunit [Streptococcus pseudoporcinus]
MNIQEIKDLMIQFDQSSLREFSFKSQDELLTFSKNEMNSALLTATLENKELEAESSLPANKATVTDSINQSLATTEPLLNEEAEGELVESPLVGVAYLSPGLGKDNYVTIGSQVKKGQTLLIIEAMKVMNEISAPHDGVITEILISNEEVVEFGSGLVRLK